MSAPDQYYTPSTGQRAYTLVDVVSSMNDQLNGVDDSSGALDAAIIVNVFAALEDDYATANDTVSTSTRAAVTWNVSVQYAQGVWQ